MISLPEMKLSQGIDLIRRADTRIAYWTGGSTTELYIFPETSSYAARDFEFRLSVATIEVPFSKFTRLGGFHRVTVVLDGSLTIHHRNRYSRRLDSLEFDSYSGGWDTTSEGVCRDFNIISQGKSSVRVLQPHSGEQFSVGSALNTFSCVYLHSGEIRFGDETLSPGDLLVLHPGADPDEVVTVTQTSDIVIGTIESGK